VDVIFHKEGAVAYLSINREQAYNALNSSVMARLEEIFRGLEEDGEVMVVVIRGVGEKAFVAGADLKEIKDAGKGRPELIRKGQGIFAKIRNSSKVVIAAVNGFSLGGGLELALACDIRIASENAKFALPEAKLGLMPGYGGTQLLPRLVGVGMAKYLILSGKMITAGEALQLGLVEKVYSSERLMEEVAALAEQIAANGPLSVRACKRAIDGGMQLPLQNALELELEEYAKVALSSDAEEGMAAFLEKRPADFKGR
jgi:enoyl-CoA hydratase